MATREQSARVKFEDRKSLDNQFRVGQQQLLQRIEVVGQAPRVAQILVTHQQGEQQSYTLYKLPTFKEGKQEPMDFLDNLLRHSRAYEIDEHRYVSVFPMCLDADANRWLDRWMNSKSKKDEVTWELLRGAFGYASSIPLSSVLKDKWRALRMETNGAGKFVDSFMQLTSQLNLGSTGRASDSSIQDWVN